jgi:hypothetical protein
MLEPAKLHDFVGGGRVIGSVYRGYSMTGGKIL